MKLKFPVVEKYVINGIDEEGSCDWCGSPQYSGDSAYELEGGNTVCSVECVTAINRNEVE